MFLEVFAVSLRKTTFATQIDNSLCLGGYVEGKLCCHSLVLQSRTIHDAHTVSHQRQRAADNGICHILETCHAACLCKFLIVGIRILIRSDKLLFADMFHTSCRYTPVCIYCVLVVNLYVILIAAILDEGENGCAWQSRLGQDAASQQGIYKGTLARSECTHDNHPEQTIGNSPYLLQTAVTLQGQPKSRFHAVQALSLANQCCGMVESRYQSFIFFLVHSYNVLLFFECKYCHAPGVCNLIRFLNTPVNLNILFSKT